MGSPAPNHVTLASLGGLIPSHCSLKCTYPSIYPTSADQGCNLGSKQMGVPTCGSSYYRGGQGQWQTHSKLQSKCAGSSLRDAQDWSFFSLKLSLPGSPAQHLWTHRVNPAFWTDKSYSPGRCLPPPTHRGGDICPSPPAAPGVTGQHCFPSPCGHWHAPTRCPRFPPVVPPPPWPPAGWFRPFPLPSSPSPFLAPSLCRPANPVFVVSHTRFHHRTGPWVAGFASYHQCHLPRLSPPGGRSRVLHPVIPWNLHSGAQSSRCESKMCFVHKYTKGGEGINPPEERLVWWDTGVCVRC